MRERNRMEEMKSKNFWVMENNLNTYNLVHNPKDSINSFVEKILTKDCCFNALSSDQIERFLDSAKEKYSVSFGSGQIFFDLSTKDSNSEKGISFIFEEIKDFAISNDFLFKPDFLIISGLYFSISSNKYSGANKEKSFKKINSLVFPFIEISADITIFASITKSIQKDVECSFLNLSCMDFFIFLPISKASSSVRLDWVVIELRIFNCVTLSRIASLAISDQFTNLVLSISSFKSDGTDKVIVGIFSPPRLFNLFNIFNTLIIFKSFYFVLGGYRKK